MSKILVADDSKVMRQIVVRTLRQAGYGGHDIVEAENGRDCLEKALAEKPDLILSDWNMPEMNGIDCLAALRGSGSTIPFGFVTSEGSEDMRARARSCVSEISGSRLASAAHRSTPPASKWRQRL